jgi:hypothetical protein
MRYIFTVFGYASELGAAQTARHTTGPISRHVLRRINDQHITAPKLERRIRSFRREPVEFCLAGLQARVEAPGEVEGVQNLPV